MELPMKIINLLRETRLPRLRAGAISAMYTGAVRIAAPTARPPQIRAATNTAKRVDNAAVREDARNNTAVSSSTLLRPKRSLNLPAARFPAIAPQPRQLTAQPSLRPPAEPPRPK